jgi:hypothetical protein
MAVPMSTVAMTGLDVRDPAVYRVTGTPATTEAPAAE